MLIDITAGLIVLIYMGAGWQTGLIRRLLGAGGIYVGLLAGRYVAPGLADYAQSTLPVNWDAVTYHVLVYAGVVALVIGIIEGLGWLWEKQLNFSVVPADSQFGMALGLVSGTALVIMLGYMLFLAQPALGSVTNALSGLLHSQFQHSLLEQHTMGVAHLLVQIVFAPAIPDGVDAFFGAP